MSEKFHQPVMLQEVLDRLDLKPDKIYLDCTFGAGGYSRAILEKANCKLIAFDRDPSALKFADILKKQFGDRFIFCNTEFSRIEQQLKQLGIDFVDGIVFDLGVSSMQLDDHERGFSFDSQARLDMRMDKNQELDAFWVVNQLPENELAKIIFEFGDEPKSRQIARKIAFLRKIKPIESCKELAAIIHGFYPKNRRTDPATKTFQAIRIFVNQELEELKKALIASKSILKPDGRLVAVSFHSLEDRIIKQFFRNESGEEKMVSRYEPDDLAAQQMVLNRSFEIVERRAICASDQEIAINPRARSAKLRWAIKI